MVRDIITTILNAAAHFITPSLCANCHNSVITSGLCRDCWGELRFISHDACSQCGVPFIYKTLLTKCGECLRDPPDVDATIAAAVYGGVIRDLVIGLKHGDRQDIAPVLAHLMAPKAMPLLHDADVILPLPLHRQRFFTRRFNQSAELARHIMKIGDIPPTRMNTHILIRHKHTEPQGRKSKNQRIAAMRNAFHVPDQYINLVKDKHIVIVDDVMTTGASIGAASKTLKRHGAKMVSAIVAARVC